MTTPVSRWLLARFGVLARGGTLHRAALAASHAGEHSVAARLFERAARAYRRELDVRALARLRVHEGIDRLRAAHPGAADVEEIERRLLRLEEIESPLPPFQVMPAADLAGAAFADPAGRETSRAA